MFHDDTFYVEQKHKYGVYDDPNNISMPIESSLKNQSGANDCDWKEQN